MCSYSQTRSTYDSTDIQACAHTHIGTCTYPALVYICLHYVSTLYSVQVCSHMFVHTDHAHMCASTVHHKEYTTLAHAHKPHNICPFIQDMNTCVHKHRQCTCMSIHTEHCVHLYAHMSMYTCACCIYSAHTFLFYKTMHMHACTQTMYCVFMHTDHEHMFIHTDYVARIHLHRLWAHMYMYTCLCT